MLAPRGAHRYGGEGPPQLLGGPARAHDLGAEPEAAALRAVPGALLAPAPPAAQDARVLSLERAGAVPAPGGRPAPGTGHAGRVTTPGHLHQHRPVPQPLTGRLPGERGQPRGAGGLVTREVVVPDRPDEGRGPAHLLPPGDQRPGPAALDELGGLHGAAPTAQQKGALVECGAQQQDVAGVRLRGVRLAVAVVPVVPDRDEAQILDGREHRRPGPDDGTHGTAPHRQPLRVPLLGPGVGGEQRVPAGAEQRGERGVHARGGAPVRYDDEGAAPGGEGGGDGPGQFLAPQRSRQRVPHGPGSPSGGQGVEEGTPVLVPAPGAVLRCRGRGQRLGGRALLGAGAARGHGQLEDIGQAARVPVGDGPGEAEQFLAQHRLGRHDLGERGQRSGVVGLGAPLDEEAVDEPAALPASVAHPVPPGPEPHPHPHPGPGVRVQLRGHGVVEVPVEVQDALVDQHPCDGQLLGERGPPPGPGLGARHLRLPHALPDERELLRRRPLGPATPRPVLAAHACILANPTDNAAGPPVRRRRRGPAPRREPGPGEGGWAGVTGPRPCAGRPRGPCAPR
ncbi:hypothetical protein SCANM63S_09774 [Streptomyces canarius]